MLFKGIMLFMRWLFWHMMIQTLYVMIMRSHNEKSIVITCIHNEKSIVITCIHNDRHSKT